MTLAAHQTLVARPVGRTRSAMSRVLSPKPQPMSSTREPST
jgi:hypothetical protein